MNQIGFSSIKQIIINRRNTATDNKQQDTNKQVTVLAVVAFNETFWISVPPKSDCDCGVTQKLKKSLWKGVEMIME